MKTKRARRNHSRAAASVKTSGMLRQLAKEFDLDLVLLFGSQATGKTHPRSDLDIAVRTRAPESLRDLEWHQRLWSSVEKLAGREDVDTVVLNEKDSLFLFEVASEGRLLYERRPGTFVQFQSYASRRYWDDEKFRRMTRDYLLRDLK